MHCPGLLAGTLDRTHVEKRTHLKRAVGVGDVGTDVDQQAPVADLTILELCEQRDASGRGCRGRDPGFQSPLAGGAPFGKGASAPVARKRGTQYQDPKD